MSNKASSALGWFLSTAFLLYGGFSNMSVPMMICMATVSILFFIALNVEVLLIEIRKRNDHRTTEVPKDWKLRC